MNASLILGVALLAAGAVVLGYDHTRHTAAGETLPVGPLTASAERAQAVSLPPVIGSVAYRRAGTLVLSAGSNQD